MSAAGIDFDTHAVHVVLLHEDRTAEYHRYELTGHDAFERVRSVRDAMPSRGWWRDEGVVACAIEEPQGAQKATVAKLKAVQGAVLACLPVELLVAPMVPARWRTVVGLKGNATKDEVKDKACEHFLVMSSEQALLAPDMSQDVWDALCLALAVSTLWERAA